MRRRTKKVGINKSACCNRRESAEVSTPADDFCKLALQISGNHENPPAPRFYSLANALLAQTTCPVHVENVLRVYPLDGCTRVFDSTEALTIEELRQQGFQKNSKH
ncbi:MAG: hypothetical protein R2788_00535 [Saprospiraceae bacterium]